MISEFAVQLKTESSATGFHINGDYHYMSPERLKRAPRSVANDVWSIGATFAQMISGQPLNHEDTGTQFMIKVSLYKIFINGKAADDFIKTLKIVH